MLNEDGWYQVAQKGSHVQFKHSVKPGRVTVKHPSKDLLIDLETISKFWIRPNNKAEGDSKAEHTP